ncbi:alpha/beta hydrolase [Streptomyces sp. HNM0574]|uniref:alpha/beta hydrolase n=1 Tax=Streptomyces sp. HNM0574 TaxID=2714954 RepID=UPI00146E5186|nr:alpha/beta hydrolase [Streptomyces sp. HNM0574]NLU66749.1 alpha/beta hydrolase [Streptomyces sp. HNM0574]
MAQHALPQRRQARIGRPMGTADGHTPDAVVLLLPGGGVARSVRRPSPVPAAAVLPLARRLVRAARDEQLAAHVVHYRCRGWNDEAAHPAGDAEWALDEVVRRYGDVPVCLAGVDVGARAALRAAGHHLVESVVALGPWLPDKPGEEPVEQLAGRHVLLVHGTDDARTDPELSYELAERAKRITPDVCRFEVHTDGHGLRGHQSEVGALAQDFVLGSLCGRDYARPVADAMAAPPPLGLRMPLASGFGKSLR